jgi:NADPH2:quinone reductase
MTAEVRMRAAYYEANGTARDVLRVGEVETPEPGAGEVRVRLATSGVNPSDVKTRAGLARKIAFPRVIPHSDGAGEIDEVGDGVAKSRIGERVWIWNAQWKRPFGSAAEYIVLSAIQAVPLPANASFADGACLGIPALTASQAVELAQAAPGTTLLVAGGAGAVSQYAIQIAKAHGATVLTTISSDEKAALVKSLGADHVINYRSENVGERIAALTGKAGVDAVLEIDLTANAKLIPVTVRPRGRVVVYGTGPQAELPASFCLVNSITLAFMLVYELTATERERAIAEVGRMLAAGKLVNNVAKTYPLADIVAAHEAVESGAVIGNVIVSL